MAKNLLTDAKCKAAIAGVSKKTGLPRKVNKLSDGEGLTLWVYDDGKKYWRFRYHFAGKGKLLSVGVFPRISLADARKKADALRNQLQSGTDPSAVRKATTRHAKIAAANTFSAVANEWYDKQRPIWSATHTLDVRRRLDKNLFPLLGHRPIAEIDALELLDTVRLLEPRARGIWRTGYYK